MVDTSILSKLSLIYEFLKENMLITLTLVLLIIIILDLCYGNNKKNTKVFYGIIIGLLILLIGIMYYKPLFNIIDIYIANIVKFMYFPSIIDYFSFILITIMLQMYSIKRKKGFLKHFNLWIGIIIELLFIVNIIALNGTNINFNTITSIYENDLLLSLFQVTSSLFIIWIIINVLVFIISMFLNNKIEIPKLNEDIY